MKVKIFIDWSRQEIMNQKEGEAELALLLKNQDDYKNYRGDYLSDIIEEWFENKPIHSSEYFKEIFDLSAEERAEIEAKCQKSYEESVKETFSNDWEEITIEI